MSKKIEELKNDVRYKIENLEKLIIELKGVEVTTVDSSSAMIKRIEKVFPKLSAVQLR